MICGGDNGTNGCHLAVFSVDVVIACHYPPSHPIEVLVVLTMLVKSYLKWQAIQLGIQCTVDTMNYLE